MRSGRIAPGFGAAGRLAVTGLCPPLGAPSADTMPQLLWIDCSLLLLCYPLAGLLAQTVRLLQKLLYIDLIDAIDYL